jgi:hypothetical protein
VAQNPIVLMPTRDPMHEAPKLLESDPATEPLHDLPGDPTRTDQTLNSANGPLRELPSGVLWC